jgi:Uma2 family endonuclease
MSATTTAPAQTVIIHYPDDDGNPMSDYTLQFEWIVKLHANLDLLFRPRPDVFVAGNLLWYPVEGDNTIRQAPDVMVAVGRPKGYRGSYKQWEEGGVAPQVVFEVWSPGNRMSQMQEKFAFYEQYGVEEYYILYPEFPAFVDGWRRDGSRFAKIDDIEAWTSPRLGIRYKLTKGELTIFGPDGRPFRTAVEIGEERADAERQRDEAERQLVAEQQRSADEQQRAEKLAAKLRAMGIDPDQV